MKTRFFLLCVVVVGSAYLAVQACASGCWRIGGSYVRLTSESTRNMLADGWAISGEYSFTHMQNPDDRWRGDISVGVVYRRFDNDTPLSQNTVDWTTIGLRWRDGAGASPASQGLYAGLGVGAAILRIQPAFNGLGEHQSVTKLEWNILGGANIGKRVYIELVYSQIPDISSIPLRNVAVTLGLRF